MNEPRASFEMVNYHGQLYAMGGFQGTQTWNRQSLSYVERYDPATDTWTNLSNLPVSMFGWAERYSTMRLYSSEAIAAEQKALFTIGILLKILGQKETTSVRRVILTQYCEEINGSIIWATGDTSSSAYSSWSQSFSDKYQFQNQRLSHNAWLTSPVIDLSPTPHSHASPVQVNLSGNTFNSADLRFQYRSSQTSNTVISQYWAGSDGTINSTFQKE